MVFGESLILKAFRRVEPGVNPELELLRFLSERGFPHIAPLAGWYEIQGRQIDATLGILQEYLAGARDGWELVLDGLADDPDALLDRIRALGEVTGELHTALGSEHDDPAFAPDEPSAESLALLTADVDEQIERLFVDLPESEALAPIAGRGQDVRERLQALSHIGAGGRVIRTHGDLHLGQTMLTDRGWVILDFEGEPARPLPERRLKRSPLRDVAGMLRSFSYAAAGARILRGGEPPEDWEDRAREHVPRGLPRARRRRAAAARPAGDRPAARRVRAREGGLRAALRAQQPARLGRDPGRRDRAAARLRPLAAGPAAARAASSAGAPNRSSRPPNAIAQTQNHAEPSASPAITSLSQCTPSSTRLPATSTASPAATPAMTARVRGRGRG